MDAELDWDNPWGDNVQAVQDSEWSKISSDFLNVGYREGITAGKEGALQEGFDEGYVQTGAPIGRRIGILRGISSVLLSLLTSEIPLPNIPTHRRDTFVTEARDISSRLNKIRFADIAPPDLEAEKHAREHLESKDGDDESMDIESGEEIMRKKELDTLEDMMDAMGVGSSTSIAKKGRPTIQDVAELTERLKMLAEQLGLSLPVPASS